MNEPCFLAASEAAAEIRHGRLSSERLVASCLARIAAREPEVRAWAWLDPEAALAQARAADASRPRGPLHGVPIGIKDVIDTADMPTALGARAFAGRRPERDAEGVALLRKAGAIILGKTVTAELATFHPGPSANPHRASHTPGGSSSGSAAAVADFHVPIALGTQTVGSIVRPASFCGILGFKPSFGRYPVEGVLQTSAHLDTLGGFARTIDDLLLLDALLAGDDAPADAVPAPVIGLYRTARWNEAAPRTREAFARFADAAADAGARIVTCAMPAMLDTLSAALTTVHLREVWDGLGHIRRDHADGVSAAFKALADEGAAVDDAAYRRALAAQAEGSAAAAAALDGIDLLLTPSARDTAPEGLAATGDPLFCRMWTGLGLPCLGFPAAWADGLPIGLQFVGRPGRDRAMLATAGRLLAALGVTAPIVTPHNLHRLESDNGTDRPRALHG